MSEYRILQGNPPEANYWEGSLKHRQKVFGHAPELAPTDRDVFSPANVEVAKRLGVKQVALPQPGIRN